MELHELEKFSIDYYDIKDQLKQHVYTRSLEAFAKGDQARDSLENKEQVEARRLELRDKFITAIGGIPSSDTPLNSIMTGIVHCEGYRIEKIIFESRPDTFVTGSLYIPAGVSTNSAAVLFLCGHDEEAKHSLEYQSVCQILVYAGLVVLAIDPIGQGERFSYYEADMKELTVPFGTLEHEYAGLQCLPLGDGLARYFVHDAMRAIDYLLTRPEVDPTKIGVTGNSGGGTQTSMLMICDPRLAAAAPGTFIMSRESYIWSGQAQDAEQIWFGMTALGLDHEDILMAMVPRPVLVLAVTNDFFPIEGTHRTIERTKRFWGMYGQADHIRLVEDESHHKYTVELAKAAAHFFATHLLGKPSPLIEKKIRVLDQRTLWCTESGQVRGEIEHARGVHEEVICRLEEIEQIREHLPPEILKTNALTWLRDRVFANRNLGELYPRSKELGQMNELNVRSTIWWSQSGIYSHALVFRNHHDLGKDLPLTIAIWEHGTRQLQSHLPKIRQICNGGRQLMVLDVSGSGALMPNAINPSEMYEFFGTIHKLTTDLFWLGDSLAAIRLFEVIRSLDMAELMTTNHMDDIQCYTYGRFSLYAQLAKAMDSRITKLEMECGVDNVSPWVKSRHYDAYNHIGLVIPGMLWHFDLMNIV